MQGGLQHPTGVLDIPKAEQWGGLHSGPCSGATCQGPASAGSRGYPQHEQHQREREKTREASLNRAKFARERVNDQTGVFAGSGNALFFTIAFIP